MKILVTGDIHAPIYLRKFYESVNQINEKIDYALLAGDIIERNQHIYFKKVYQILIDRFNNVKVFGVFGNNEPREYREMYKREYSFINWLDFSYYDLGKYYLFGFSGIPERGWKIDLTKEKEEMKKKIKEIFENLRDKEIIVLMHYGVIKETILGDPAPEWSLYSKEIGNLILSYENVRYIFHGHSHLAKNWKYKIGNKEVYNVSFPIHNKPLIFDI